MSRKLRWPGQCLRSSACAERRAWRRTISTSCGYPRAPQWTRTDTGRILSPLPLPIGLWGPAANVSAATVIRDIAPLDFGHFPDVRPGRSSRSIRAPRASLLFCGTNQDDTTMSAGGSC